MFKKRGCPVFKHKVALIFLTLLAIAASAFAAQPEPNEPNESEGFFQMSLEELMEVQIVLSASRQPQKIGELSVPVSIITAEDIHYSGLTTIPDILTFTPGVDVLALDRNTYATGVRGLHGRYSNRVLSLLDGRDAESSVFGGPEFFRLPLFMEDIERIEVVRGPGGAAWGANAFTGVINVITKDPNDCLGWLGSTTFNDFGDSYTHLRWGDKAGKWRWRFSSGYEDRETSDDAIADDHFYSHDFSRNYRYDWKAIYDSSETTKWSMGAGYSHIEEGNFDAGSGTYKRELRRFETGRSFARIDKAFSDTTTGHIQWFGNFALTKYPDALSTYTAENDIESQLNFIPAINHNVSIGGNFRHIHITSSAIGGDQGYTFRDGSADEYWAGLFAIDRWKATGRLTVEGQIRGDWYSETQTDWSARLTTLYTLNEERQRVLRFSAAKAFRAPLLTQREGQKHAGTHFIPGLYWFNIIAPDDLKNEETWSLEAGYSEQLNKWLTFRADLYYQRLERLLGDKTLPDPLGVWRTLETLDNIDGADSYGCEAELTANTKVGKFSSWYAINKFYLDRSDQQVDAYLPAPHKAGLTARVFLPYDSTLNMNYRFTSATSGKHADLSTYTSPGVSHRFDISVAKQIAGGNGELMLGVSDLFNRINDPVEDTWKHPTPGRTFFVRLQLKF
jgi:iron complex outermembrane receptor protein